MTPQHCDHEYVCPWHIEGKVKIGKNGLCKKTGCDYDTRTSHPTPLTHDDTGNCLIICWHCSKVTQVQCAEAAQARGDILTALAQDWKGRYVEDAVAEIRRFPESLRTGGEPR